MLRTLTGVALLVTLCGCDADPDPVEASAYAWPSAPPISDSLHLALGPTTDPALERWFVRLASYLEAATARGRERGIAVGVSRAASEEELRAGLVDGRYHLAFTGPLFAVRLRDDPRLAGAELLATSVMDAGTSTRSYLVAREDAPYTDLLDLEGATLVAPDPGSIAGYIFPRSCAARLRFHPDHFFGPVRFLGSHDSCLVAVLREPGVVAGLPSTQFGFDTSIAQNGLKVLAKSNPIPNAPLIAGPTVPASDRDLVRAALLNLDDGDGAGLLRGELPIHGWVPPAARSYDDLARLVDAVRED